MLARMLWFVTIAVFGSVKNQVVCGCVRACVCVCSYRKVPGDSCSGGDVESRLDGELLPCPVGGKRVRSKVARLFLFVSEANRRTPVPSAAPESNEFILYAVRNAIHRYDLATGDDQPLPLSGLREAVALDFDYERNCLYWADISLDTIQVS